MNLKPDKGHVAKVRSAGFFTKGVVYVLIGTLTFLAAFDQGGDISSTDGAVKYLLTLPLGKFLGAVVALVWWPILYGDFTRHCSCPAPILLIKA